jgi:hypothetical protein
VNLDSAVSELKSQLKGKPELLQEEKEVIQKLGSIFRYDNIDNISAEEFRSFLDFKYNRHWTLHRLKTGITKDMPKLRAALKILLNESTLINYRPQKKANPYPN